MKMDIDLNDYDVKKFKLQVIFQAITGENGQDRVTVAVTHPDTCDLKDREIDNTVRELLKKNGNSTSSNAKIIRALCKTSLILPR